MFEGRGLVDSLLVDRDVDEFQGSFSIDYTSQLGVSHRNHYWPLRRQLYFLREIRDEGCDDCPFYASVSIQKMTLL